VALGWVAVDTFGPAAGYLAAAKAAIILLTALVGGSLADRWDRRRTMVGADLCRCLVLLLLVGAWIARGHPDPWLLVATIVVLAAGEAFFEPALQTMLPVLVEERELLVATNALLDATDRLARLLGPGLIAALGALVPTVHFFSLDAASFLVSAVAVGMLRVPHDRRPVLPADRASVADSLLRGFRAMRRDKLLGYLLTVGGIVNGIWYAVFFLAVPLAIGEHLDRPGAAGLAAYGVVFSCYGLSNLAANVVIGSRLLPARPAGLIFLGNFLIGAGIALMGVACLPVVPLPWRLPAFTTAAAIAGFGGPLKDIPTATLRQLLIAPVDMAAAMRATLIVSSSGLLAAMALAPLACARLGSIGVMLFAAAVYCCVALAGWLRFSWPRGPTGFDVVDRAARKKNED
jgi:DHA3 family macrolide efflux protein-like MFS transporter